MTGGEGEQHNGSDLFVFCLSGTKFQILLAVLWGPMR